jgi:hypothetical protein
MNIDDFDIFEGNEEMPTSKEADLKVMMHAYREINPSQVHVFAKLNFIFFMTTLVTTLFIPQFGASIVKWPALYEALSQFNDNYIQAIFGFLLLGLCMTAAVIFLTRDELRVLRRTRFFHLPTLCLIMLLAFFFLGLPVHTTATLFWVAGSLVGMFSALELGYAFRYGALEKQLLAS